MRRLITSLIAILAVTNLEAQQQAPKLVVCITVDQLRGDYIDYFYNSFGEGGFKRLLNEGRSYKNIRFEFSNVDQASAFATLFTGSNPCYHGIPSIKKFDFNKGLEVSILNDPNYLGNYTQENYSPKALLASTIGDELKIASKGRSDVYAIAPDPESAILSAGHAANGAFWMDDYNGKWATTTYFKGIPWYVDRYNSGPESLTSRLEKMVWTPSLPLDKLNAFPYILEDIPFKYTFSEKSGTAYLNLKTSPFINKEINRLAIQFLEYGAFGTRSCPDMLAITYYAGNYRGIMNKEYTREIQDTYYQLDKDIEQLLQTIDKKVGLTNTLIVFTGSGYYKSIEDYPEGMPLGGGEFHPKRCIALLNMYLMAIYGQTNWVTGYYNNQIYLNRKGIEDAKISLPEMQMKAAEFVREFSGVQNVTTDFALRTGDWNEGTSPLRQGTHHLGRGDLVIELQPGWLINKDNNKEKPKVVRNNAVITPLIFLGNGIKPEHIYREIKATEVAPTVTHVLRIRPPNASQDLPLSEFSKK
ncbi:MAG: alkaline phosphatase family protein [Massilibacteroides sp.]|nr:alkaline phosphatase family protein [Massilibacteroides sp.]MDD3061619.1 alkaline phosphatase family protein [Massilibacteroides sp.]MDD4115101.1 alkaline phosphatase family protein [Massilibacteroides sp.]MDD4659997.1 alkaline phosphatase family protein [Massilibacteroides sp.]